MSTHCQVLCIGENTAQIQQLAESEVRDAQDNTQKITVTRRATLTQGLATLASSPMDAVVINLAAADSLEALPKIRRHASNIPIIVLTDKPAQRYRDAGAQDCLPRAELSSPLLNRSLRYVLERRRAQESARQYQQLFTQHHVPTLLIDAATGDIFEGNHAACRFYGYTAKELKQKSIYEINTLPKEEIQRRMAETEGETQRHFFFQHQRADGSVRDVEVYSGPMTFQGESLLYSHVYDVTQRRATEEALGWESTVNRMLADLAKRLIVTTNSVDDVSALILEKACEITGSQTGFAGYTDFEADSLVLAATFPTPKGRNAANWLSQKSAQLWDWALEHQKPLLSNNVADDERFEFDKVSSTPQRFLSVPARIGTEIVGQIALAQTDSDYMKRDQEVVERLSSLYALALQRYHTEKALQHYAHEQAALYNISTHIASLDKQGKRFSNVLETVLGVLDAQAGWISTLTEKKARKLEVVAHKGIPKAIIEVENRGLMGECPIYQALVNATPLPQNFVTSCPHVYQGREGLKIQQHVCIPLQAGGETLGILTVLWCTPEQIPPFDEFFYEAVGQQIGIALHNAQLYRSARQVDRLNLLNELDTTLTATLDPERITEEALRHLTLIMGAPSGALLLCDRHTERCLSRRYNSADDKMQVLRSDHPALNLSDIFPELPQRARKRPHSIHDLTQMNPEAKELEPYWGAETLLVPLEGETEMQGALLLNARQNGQPYSDEDLALLQASVSRVGQILQNAHLYADLKRLLREREQTQAHLVQTEKMAALGRLVASLAHEINNPLQAVQGCLNLAGEDLTTTQEPPNVADLKEYIHIAETETLRISDIIMRMRNFYRPSRSEKDPADVHDVLKSVLTLARKQLQHSEVEVQQDLAEEVPPTQIDTNHLKQVLLNMVLNGIDAMPEGGTLTVHTGTRRVRLSEQETEVVHIAFADTGVGIAPEDQPRIFEPFFTTKENGSGLGLSISYSIIKEHGGDIRVESQPSEGSTFSILLPMYTEQQKSERENET